MALDFDFKMLLYLAIITIGIFVVPIQSDPPYYLVTGLVMIGTGMVLVYRKVKKK
jgi:glucose dehydrogenase